MPLEKDQSGHEEIQENSTAFGEDSVSSEEDIHNRYIFQVARAIVRRKSGTAQEQDYLKNMSEKGFVEQFAEEIETKVNELRRSAPEN